MRKILFNQFFIKEPDIVKSIYESALKNKSLESDVIEAIKFSKEYYEANLFYPSTEELTKSIQGFEFITEKFKTSDDELIYLKEKEKALRDIIRKDILMDLLSDKVPVDKRLNKLDELQRMEIALFDNEELLTDVSVIDVMEMYNRRKNKKAEYFTNIPELDDITGGITSGKMAVIIAPSKSFKSTFAYNTTYVNLNKPGNNTLFISLEIPRDELYYKLLVRHSYAAKKDLSTQLTLKGKLDTKGEEVLKELSDDFQKNYLKSKLIIMESRDIKLNTLSEFRNQLEEIVRKNEITTIIVDYVQLFRSFKMKGYSQDFEMLNDIVGIFRLLGVTYDVRSLILSQLTKDGHKQAIKSQGDSIDPTNASDCSALIRDCYYMISLFSNEDLKNSKQLKIALLLHRDGETFSSKMTFVIPEKFLIGKMEDFGYDNLMNVKEDNIVKNSDNISAIDLFDEK